MDFSLSAEQIDVRDMVRRFSQQEIAPHAADWDEQNYFPRETFAKMATLGLLGMTIPEAYGGTPLDRLTGALVYEELAHGDMATAVGFGVHNMVANTLGHFGNVAQCERWLPRLASGEILGAFSLSEASSGSDAASLQCQAQRQDDAYLVDGSKMWVTNGGEADIYLLLARSTAGKKSAGVTCLMVEKGTEGFSFGKRERKMGLHASPTRELIFSHCTVPAVNRLSEEGQGFKVALSALDSGRVNLGAIAVGVAQAACDVACAYAREREQFGQPIGLFQAIQFMLADMVMKIEAARLLVYQAAYKMDHGEPASMYASMAKCFATDIAMEVTTNAVQVLGGAGYVHDYPVERYMRDIKVSQIFEGTNQIQRLLIARTLLGDLR